MSISLQRFACRGRRRVVPSAAAAANLPSIRQASRYAIRSINDGSSVYIYRQGTNYHLLASSSESSPDENLRGGGGGGAARSIFSSYSRSFSTESNKNKNNSKNSATTTSAPSPSPPPAMEIKQEHHQSSILKSILPAKNRTQSQSQSRTKNRIIKRVRKGVGSIFSGIGFVTSSVVSLATDPLSITDRSRKPIRALRQFLQTSGVDLELSQSLNRHLATNLALLGRVHSEQQKTIRQEERYHDNIRKRRTVNLESSSSSSTTATATAAAAAAAASTTLFWEEARRYMRYSTAVYGQAMIHAAQMDVTGRLDGRLGQLTVKAVSNHIGVPAEDIVLMDVDYDGDAHHLRHFVAVDHENSKVVLSIRGTFSLQEIVVDVAGFSREFCGGEGHSEMATMAERVWAVAGPTVENILKEHPDYEFIICGHSLGAGTACLLMVLLQSPIPNQMPKNQPMRCFAYAAPPVFAPLNLAPPKAVKATTNFIHENDVVPFLSVHSVRHLFASLRTIEAYASGQNNNSSSNKNSSDDRMSRMLKYQVVLGLKPPPLALIEAVVGVQQSDSEFELELGSEPECVSKSTTDNTVEPRTGAPPLEISAGRTIWLRELDDDAGDSDFDGEYGYEEWDPTSLQRRNRSIGTIQVHQDMLVDHFPPRYEHAFDHLKKT